MAFRPTLTLGLTAALATGCPPVIDDDDDDVDDYAPLTEFRDAAPGYLEELAVPIVDCTQRSDTGWPAFDGCIDWHSHVHGTYSLLTLTRLLGDPAYAAVADDILLPDDVAAELALLQDGTLDSYELPYGFAWFLALARERERAGDLDLAPLAEEIAGRLEDDFGALSPAAWDTRVRAPDYDNAAWALLNLHAHHRFTGDDDGAAWVEQLVRDELVPRSNLCPLTSVDLNVLDFFPPCLQHARAVVEILPDGEAADWLDEHLPADLVATPLTDIASAHPGGLNFSRAWGLWSLYKATGDTDFADLYIDHVATHVALPEYWADDYFSYSHWVPQFGVYAIALSWGDGELVP